MSRSDEIVIELIGHPTPGSDEAIKQGCTCPVLDNAHGRGAYGKEDTFWISSDCPIHASSHEQHTE